MRKFYTVLVLGAIVFLSGCASVPMGSLIADTQAKEFSPQEGKAALYIYRNETFGAAIPMSVGINGKNLGQTAAQTYFHLDVIPGRYEIDSRAENVSQISLLTEAGKNYFVWQEVKMGMWMARTQVQQVSEDDGRKGVLESKLAASVLKENDLTPLDVSNNTVGNSNTVPTKLKELQSLRNDGLITDLEYKAKKSEILEKM